MVAPFPQPDTKWIDKNVEDEMMFVQWTIDSIRNVRGELSVPPSKEISIIISFAEGSRADIIQKYQSYFQRLARVTKIDLMKNGQKPHQSASAVVEGGEVFIPLEGIIDLKAERERIEKEIAHNQKMFESIES